LSVCRGALTTFYSYDNYKEGSLREVGADEIIANLYSYYQSNVTILFYKLDSGSFNRETKTFSSNASLKKVELYKSPALDTYLGKSNLTIDSSGNGKRSIYGVDIQDESTIRNESWKGSAATAKAFIDCLISGQEYQNTNIVQSGINDNNSTWVADKVLHIKFNYNKDFGVYLNQASNKLFVERDGEYIKTSTTKTSGDGTTSSSSGTVSSYTQEINGETIETYSTLNTEVLDENSNNEIKRVIQYIYVGDK